jgi:hypothetical protein
MDMLQGNLDKIVRHGKRADAIVKNMLLHSRTFAEGAAATPECHDNPETTIRQPEGPFFRPSSPKRADLRRSWRTRGFSREKRGNGRASVAFWHSSAREARSRRYRKIMIKCL